jgi:hypothetical protein|tara:strand:+ start:211 stop:1116 length:906 start_codon:yes stop_codon:yes gene_type:complete
MEMFNQKVLKERIGPLKKNKALNEIEQVEGYVIRKCSEHGIETSYDVLAEEMPYFKTLAYTEFATSFYMQPLNVKLRNEQMLDAWNDNVKNPDDWSSYLVDNILNKAANKYEGRRTLIKKWPAKDYLLILPGSNKVKKNVCLNRLRALKKKHGDNIYFKPHPITTHQVIGELKDFFGEDCVLPRDVDMYYYMQKAKAVYTTHISESAIYAAVLGKKIEPVDVWNAIQHGSFYCINNYLFTNQKDIRKYINKCFSSYKSGIINPRIDKNWREKVDKYFEYILSKRNVYKDWFIDNRKPKPKK